MSISKIETGTAVPTARRLSKDEGGRNETFRGVIETESGRHKAYIKLLSGKQLINELLICSLGQILDLPIPQGFLIRVRRRDLSETEILANCGLDEEFLAFASKDLSYRSLERRLKNSPALLEKVLSGNRFKRWDEALVFDEWVANIDRNCGNLLLAGRNEIWLIDHEHSLTGADWEHTDLISEQEYRNKLATDIIPKLDSQKRTRLQRKTFEATTLYKALDIKEILSASHADDLLEVEEVGAVIEFLEKRSMHLESIIASRLGVPQIPGLRLIQGGAQ